MMMNAEYETETTQFSNNSSCTIDKTLLDHHLTDAGNADSFKTLYGSQFCYVPQKGKWFRWDGVRWIEDSESVVPAMIKTVRKLGKIGMTLNDNDNEQRSRVVKWSLGSEANYRIKAAISLAEPLFKVDYTDFDKDQYLLCCADGIVDLRTGKFRAANPED